MKIIDTQGTDTYYQRYLNEFKGCLDKTRLLISFNLLALRISLIRMQLLCAVYQSGNFLLGSIEYSHFQLLSWQSG